MNDQVQLLNTWAKNFKEKEKKINNNLLLLVFNNAYRNPMTNLERFKEVFLKDIDKEYYQLVNLHELDNIDELLIYRGKKNIIVFGYVGMDINKIAYTNFEILLFFNPHEHIFTFKTFNDLLVIDDIKRPYIKLVEIKKRDPIDIINLYGFVELKNFIEVLFFPHILNESFSLFLSINILKSDKNTYSYPSRLYCYMIWDDVKLLAQKRKLTSRLAIAIYKVATLRFNDNNTKIGTFFREQLGVKSKSYRLPKNNYPRIIKVYNLGGDN